MKTRLEISRSHPIMTRQRPHAPSSSCRQSPVRLFLRCARTTLKLRVFGIVDFDPRHRIFWIKVIYLIGRQNRRVKVAKFQAMSQCLMMVYAWLWQPSCGNTTCKRCSALHAARHDGYHQNIQWDTDILSSLLLGSHSEYLGLTMKIYLPEDLAHDVWKYPSCS